MNDQELVNLLYASHQLDVEAAERRRRDQDSQEPVDARAAKYTETQRDEKKSWPAVAAGLMIALVPGAIYHLSAVARLSSEITRSEVRNAINVEDFSASGRNTIAVKFSVDPRYIKRVVWTVRGEDERELFAADVPARDDASRVEKSEKAQIELGTGRFTSVLRFEPFEDAARDLAEFFPRDKLVQERRFDATFDGLITDPVGKEDVILARLDYILFKDEPNLYKIAGRISRDLLGKHGWIVGYEDTSETYYVFGGVFVDDQRNPPTFNATCRLGDPGDDFELFAVFSDDVRALHSGGTIPLVSEFDWSTLVRSESKSKRNDKKDGFTEQGNSSS